MKSQKDHPRFYSMHKSYVLAYKDVLKELKQPLRKEDLIEEAYVAFQWALTKTKGERFSELKFQDMVRENCKKT